MTKFFAKYRKNIIYIFASLFVIISLILANLFANFIVPMQSESQQISSSNFQLHLISLAKSQLKNEAESHSKDFQAIGAGGYVWEHDDYFHIITSGYLNKTDAELVQNSIKLNLGLESELICLDFPAYSVFGDFDAEQTKALNSLLVAPIQFYCSIYDISISLDTGVFNEISAKLTVNTALNNYSKTLADFNTLFNEPLPENLNDLYNMIIKCYQSAQKLSMGEKKSEQQTYSSLLKYRYLEIMEIYFQFITL